MLGRPLLASAVVLGLAAGGGCGTPQRAEPSPSPAVEREGWRVVEELDGGRDHLGERFARLRDPVLRALAAVAALPPRPARLAEVSSGLAAAFDEGKQPWEIRAVVHVAAVPDERPRLALEIVRLRSPDTAGVYLAFFDQDEDGTVERVSLRALVEQAVARVDMVRAAHGGEEVAYIELPPSAAEQGHPYSVGSPAVAAVLADLEHAIYRPLRELAAP